MALNGPPAWSYFLGAVVALAFGVLTLKGNMTVGAILLVVGLGLAIMGIQAGRKSMAALPAAEAAGEPESSSPMPLEARERSVSDYADESAVRSIEKPKRTCRECNSPVLPNAAECPTCGSAL